MLNDAAKSLVVSDREPDEEKIESPSGPRIRCSSALDKEDKWFCDCGHEWNTFDTEGVCHHAFISGPRRNAPSDHRVTVGDYVLMMSKHGPNHLEQIEQLKKEAIGK
ncbi:MAG TPA: hypothetical protein VNO32_32975 [Candidatus Acidoferrum sp.]|nr:hypothetical protein [Candidatus Acidoferrum sp.]